MAVQIRDSDGTVRLSGDLLATGGATGDVLTQQTDGTYAPAAGGAAPTTRAIYGGNNVSIPNTGVATSLTWDTLLNGSALLDLSVPALPTIVTAGVYALTVQSAPASSMTDGKAYRLNLTVNGGETDVVTLEVTCVVEDSFDFDTSGFLSVTYHLAAGSFIELSVQQADAGAINFPLLSGILQRLA